MAKKEPTKQTLALVAALKKRGVGNVETEYWDGHKHIDIYVPGARLYIEVDGLQHYTHPKQIVADFQRDHFSDDEEIVTKHIPNGLIETRLDEIADAIALVAKNRENPAS